ncbi:MAG: membrane protein insertase YidC [Pseudomonadota bacterium]
MDQKNVWIAMAIILVMFFAYQFFYELPRLEREQALLEEQQQTEAQTEQSDAVLPDVSTATTGDTSEAELPAVTTPDPDTMVTRDEALAESARITIETPSLHGSVSLSGGKFDDLTLRKYRETVSPSSPEVTLFSPVGGPDAYWAEFGWLAQDENVKVPTNDTVWQTSDTELTPGSPLNLTWDNGEGLVFQRAISVDENYMFTVTQSVTNNSGSQVTLFPYGLVNRYGTPETLGFYILHEGLIGVFDETLTEIDYDDVIDEDGGRIDYKSTSGWIGITDKYWLAALVPDQTQSFDGRFVHDLKFGNLDTYQADFLREGIQIPAGGSAEVTDHLFAGAKVVTLLDAYAETLNIPLFDRAVDFGWFYFLTKPIFFVLLFFKDLLGNFGLAILLLTVVIKLIFFPLANKSYKAMSKMRKLAPEMKRLRERYKDDKQKMQQELMAMYKKEKVNPASGCLPILIQIPVFFALYKVLFVTIEMRHAPFYGWISDLSAPDPTSILNLFGLLPFSPDYLPALVSIGAWPLLMAGTMYLQQKISPQPPDPMQARIFMLMPIFFLFIFNTFPAGLVIYWTWNNLLSIAQQWFIMKRMGVS